MRLETLPSVTQYGVYLDRICELTGISRVKARQNYGQFTIGEFEKEIIMAQVKQGLVPCVKLDAEPVIDTDLIPTDIFLTTFVSALHPDKGYFDCGKFITVFDYGFRSEYHLQENNVYCEKWNVRATSMNGKLIFPDDKSEWFLYDVSKLKQWEWKI